MKFYSVAFVAVLVCAVLVNAEDPAEKDIENLRKELACMDGVFVKMIPEYKELEKYHRIYKTYANEANSYLDECENSDDKEECVYGVEMLLGVHRLTHLWSVLHEENADLAKKLSDAVKGAWNYSTSECKL